MPSYTISQRSCAGGARTVSPAVTVPGRLSSVTVRLTSTEWSTKTGTLRFGLDRSDDGGKTWWPWVVVPADFDAPIAIGALGRNSELPFFSLSGADLNSAAGSQVRLWAQPSVTIRLGAAVTAE